MPKVPKVFVSQTSLPAVSTTPAAAAPALVVKDVTRNFAREKVTALAGISLQIFPGQILVQAIHRGQLAVGDCVWEVLIAILWAGLGLLFVRIAVWQIRAGKRHSIL